MDNRHLIKNRNSTTIGTHFRSDKHLVNIGIHTRIDIQVIVEIAKDNYQNSGGGHSCYLLRYTGRQLNEPPGPVKQQRRSRSDGTARRRLNDSRPAHFRTAKARQTVEQSPPSGWLHNASQVRIAMASQISVAIAAWQLQQHTHWHYHDCPLLLS